MDQCTSEKPGFLKNILPMNEPCRICSVEENDYGMLSTIRLPLFTKEDAHQWIAKFQQSSYSTWRVDKTYHVSEKGNVFRVDLRCQHQTYPRSSTANGRKGSKNTNCPATVSLVVKRSCRDVRGRRRSKDPHIADGYPGLVKLRWTHNHDIMSADVLRKRDVLPATVNKVLCLLRSGHSPTSALDILKYDLQVEFSEEDYTKVSADRAYCPDLQFCYRLFYKVFSSHNEGSSAFKMVTFLEQNIKRYNAEHDGTYVVMKTTDDVQTVVAMCTPLMRRVHRLWNCSRHLMFIDSSRSMGRHNCRAFLLLTYSPAGTLPLGVVITSSESESALVSAFELLKSVLPSDSFFGRHFDGLDVILTDDCRPLRAALRRVFTRSVLLLCPLHLLQATWRWLWEAKHAIGEHDRPHLLSLLRQMLFAGMQSDLTAAFKQVTQTDPISARYPNYVSHVQDLYERNCEWSMAARNDLNIGGNNSTVLCEAGMRIMRDRDRILHRLKGYNVCQLTDFVLTRYDDYYCRKITDVVDNRLPDYALWSQFYPAAKDVSFESIEQVSDNDYTVWSSGSRSSMSGSTMYTVNMDMGLCTCPVGSTGAPCKHQGAVLKKFNIPPFNPLPVSSPDTRESLRAIATDLRDRRFQPLRHGVSYGSESHSASHVAERQLSKHDEVNRGHHGTDNEEIQSRFNAIGEHREDTKDDVDKQANHIECFDEPNAADTSLLPTVSSQLRSVLTSISSVYGANPAEFEHSITKFIRNFSQIKTNSHLKSALSSFGRYSGTAPARNIKARSSTSLRSSKRIGFQPPSVARRNMFLGWRHGLTCGRPTKASLIGEHQYCKKR